MVSATTDRRRGLTADKGMKAPVDCATLVNITLSGEQTIDGVLTSGSRVLVKNQTDTTQNGFWDSSSAAWTRCIDSNGNGDLVKGQLVAVTGGTQSGTYWHITSSNPILIGNAIVFAQDLTNTTAALIVLLLTSVGAAMIGFIQAGVGAVLRTVQSKLREQYSVLDFGAVGDGVTDDTAAITAAALAARTAGKALYFPAPTSFYKVTSALKLGGSSHWIGENGASTIIRNTAGGGASVLTCDSTGSLGPYVLEHLRIGGIGSIGLTATATSFNGTIVGTALTVNSGLVGGIEIGGTVTGAGVSAGTVIVSGAGSSWVVSINQAVGPVTMTMTNQYVVKLTMRHVNFEGDLLTGLDANVIFANWQDCGFGTYTQTSYNANFTCFKSNGNGTLNTNLNSIDRCQFYGSTASYAINLSNGGLWRFKDCDWEGNVRNLTTSNIAGLIIDNGYTERVGAATGQAFDFGVSRTRVKVTGGTYNGAVLTAGVSMFGATATCPLLVEDADISTSASAFAYINTTAVSHTPAPTGVHHFKDNRVQGNAADPLLWMDNLLESTIYAWTPAPTNLTIVNVSGLPTYSGQYWFVGRQCFFTIKISVPGTSTTASTENSTYFLPPNASMPIPNSSSTVGVVDESVSGHTLGTGLIYSGNGRIFMPTWAARTGNVVISGSFLF